MKPGGGRAPVDYFSFPFVKEQMVILTEIEWRDWGKGIRNREILLRSYSNMHANVLGRGERERDSLVWLRYIFFFFIGC